MGGMTKEEHDVLMAKILEPNKEDVEKSIGWQKGCPEGFGLRYYNRLGEKIGGYIWALLQHEPEYKILREERVGPYFVSTVWLGINHNFFHENGDYPIIFETMIFDENGDEVGGNTERYSTEEEALKGHEFAVHAAKMLEIAGEFDKDVEKTEPLYGTYVEMTGPLELKDE